MRIALFSDRFYPQVDGIAVHVYDLATALSKKGHKVLLYAPKPHKSEDQLRSTSHLSIRYLPSIPLPSGDVRIAFPFSLEVLSEIKDFQPHVCHFHTPFMVGFQGILASKLLNIPLVGTFHSYFMEPEYLRIVGLDKVKLDNNFIINKAGWNYSNFFYNRSDVVIVPSKFTRKDLLENKVKVPVKVISNGIAPFARRKSKMLHFKLPKSYILHIGRLSIEKNIGVLIRSFAVVAAKNKLIDFVIVGDGPIKKDLVKLANELHLEKRVHFLGLVQHKDLVHSNLFDNALAFVTASKSETQCISILEAMKFGLPIIGVDARGVSELIDGNGILCKTDKEKEIADAVTTLYSDKKLQKQYSKKSLQLIQKHALDHTIRSLTKQYKLLTANKRKNENGSNAFNPKQLFEEMFRFKDF